MEEETPITSAVPNALKQLPRETFDGPRTLVNSSPCSRSTATSRPSPLVSEDNFQKPAATTNPPSYASALKHEGASHEKEIANARSQPPMAPVVRKENEWKGIPVRGSKGEEWRDFQLTHVDDKGKLHHGSLVRGANKSVECRIHKNTDSSRGIDRCTFAHSWRGDTTQFVCTKCTEDNKPECKQKREHEEFIWNLGPYITKEGKIWKGTGQMKTSKYSPVK